MALSDVNIRQAKPLDRPYKLADEKGLYVVVNACGSKLFRMKYRFGGKEGVLSFGPYPDISLKQARDRRDEARKFLAEGKDPGHLSRVQKRAQAEALQDTFESVGRDWMKTRGREWTKSYADKVESSLRRHAFPSIGSRPVSIITPPEVLSLLRAIEKRGTVDMAHRVGQYCGSIFRFAIATGRATYDPVPSLKGALATNKKKHYASIIDPSEFAELILDIENYRGEAVTKAAMQMLALTFQRTKEIRFATWDQIDLDADLWRIPASIMKMRETHLVPLSRQAKNVLVELKPLTGNGHLIFPSTNARERPISENTVIYALARMGYKGKMTGHGFRSSASTMLNELGYREDVIERQLSHEDRNQIRAAYNRAEYLPERRVMMQAWADYLETLKVRSRRHSHE